MTRRRAPTPHPALRVLASIPLAGVLSACSPPRGEPPLPPGVAATVPVTAPGLIAAGEIIVDAARSPQVPVGVVAVQKDPAANAWTRATMPAKPRCRTRPASSNARRESEADSASTGCADTRP